MTSKRLFPLVFIATMIVISSVLVYYFQMKQNFHIDELYSYGLSNSFFKPFPFDKNQWLSGDYYKNYLSPTAQTRFRFDSVYYNQAQDVHPPLYYFLLHSIASFFPGFFSKWLGLTLNLIIHLLTFGVLFTLLNQITKKRWIALFGAAFWALSMGGLSSALFIRMYHLVGLLQLSLLTVSLKVLIAKKTQVNRLLSIALLCFLGGLTHYYFYLYAFGLVLCICLLLLFQKKVLTMFFYGMSALLGVMAALASFPAVFTHLTESNRGQEVMGQIDQSVFSTKNPFIVFLKQELFLDIRLGYLLVAVVLLSLFVLYTVFQTKNTRPLWLLTGALLPVATYVLLVQTLSHYQTPRYIYSVYPVLIAGTVLLMDYAFKGIVNKNWLQSSLIVGLLIGGISWSLLNKTPHYLYADHQTLQSLVVDEAHQNIFVLGDEYWKVSQVVAEIKDFKAVYPSIITNSLSNLPDEIEGDGFYVLMLPHKRNNYQRVIQDIGKKYHHKVETTIEIEADRILYYLVKE